MPQATDSSSSSSSSSESSTDTEMGLVDMCTILCENSEAESRCRGGLVTLDLTKWNFSKADCRKKCRKLVEISKQLLLIGSTIDLASTGQPSTGRGDKEQARTVLHLAFICELYEIQVHGGRYFLHTHSHSADSWEQPTVVDFMNRFPDTFQIPIGASLAQVSLHGVNTLTRWLTNSGCIAQALSSSTHSSTVRQTIMSAMSQQLQSDLSAAGTTDPTQHRLPWPKLDILAVDADETRSEEWEAEDDVKGGPLDPREVKAARQKEIQYLWDMEVYECSTEAESKARAGRNPVGLKWIDTNKGSAEAPRYRSRLVCTEVRHKGVEPIFSATPPLETLRVLLYVACQEDVFRVEDPFPISIADVSRAHFYADAVRDVYVRLLDEDPKAKQPGVCGKFRKTMYGSLDAAQRWGEHYAQVLETGGFSRGRGISRAIFSAKTWRRTSWCTAKIFT